MADGKTYLDRERRVVLTNTTAQPKYTAVKAGATQGQVTVAGAGEQIVGVLAEAVAASTAAREVTIIEAIPGSVIPMISASAIARQTSSVPTWIVPVADGEVDNCPTADGTYWVIGKVDIDSPATTTGGGGDIVHVYVEPMRYVIPTLTDGIGLPLTLEQGDVLYYDGTKFDTLAHGTKGQFLQTKGNGANPAWVAPLVFLNASIEEATAGKTSTVFFTYDLPANIAATVVDVGFSAIAVGAAGATIDVLEAGTTILDAVIDAAAGEVKGVVTDAAIAAGATITAKYTTGASSGKIEKGNLTILLRLVDGT